MTADDREPIDLAAPSIDLMRRWLDALNRQFVAMSDNLDRIDSNIAGLIGTQPQTRTTHSSDEPE